MNAAGLIESVTVETRFTPPIVLDKPLAGGAPNPLMAFLMPRITIKTPYGSNASAPYGSPNVNYWPQVQIALTLGLAGALWLMARGLRK